MKLMKQQLYGWCHPNPCTVILMYIYFCVTVVYMHLKLLPSMGDNLLKGFLTP